MPETAQMPESVEIDPAAIMHREGLLWHWRGPELPWGDIGVAPRASELVLEEDGRPIGPAHAPHPEIASLGRGRYSHWGRDLFFSSSDGSPPNGNGRRYTVRLVQPVSKELHQRLMVVGRRLGRGWTVPDDELPPLLTLRNPNQRAWVFEQLGLALLSYGRNREGGEQLRRAWTLGRAPALYPCIEALLERGAFHEIWSIISQAALLAESRGDVDLAVEALIRLHEANYAVYAAGQPIPGYQDPVVAPVARRLLAPYRRRPAKRQPGPLRVGYLLAGEAGDNYSSLPDIAIQIACGHDPSKVTPLLLSVTPRDLLAASPFHAERQARLTAAGVPLHYIDMEAGSAWLDRLLAGAAQVEALDLDALVPFALTRWGSLLAMLRPARAVLGVGLGDPHLYASPDLDFCIHFATKPAMDAFCPSATAPAFMPRNRFAGSPSRRLTRPGLGLPSDVPVFFASGRPRKFRSRRLWEIVAAVLADLPDLCFAACGLDQAGLDELPQEWLPQALRPRVHALGWRNDILDIYPLIDIVIDTVPYGGGYSLAEPMSLGIPVISFRDDPLEGFREHTWLPTVEMLGLQEEAFAIGDTAGIVSYIRWLTTDKEHRRQAGEAARMASRRWIDSTAFVAAMEAAIEESLAGFAGA